MARLSPIQESFASGEIDKRLYGRVSLDIYRQGLKRARNWRPLVQGPIRLREGSSYITPVDSSNWVSGAVGATGLRSFTFQRDLDNDLIVEIGAGKVIIISTTGAPVIGGESGNLIPEPLYTSFPSPNGFPNAIWDCDRDKYIVVTDPGRYDGLGFDPNDDLLGGFIVGTENAYMIVNSNGGKSPYVSPGGFHSCAFENSTASPIVIPAGSELLTNTLTVRWKTRFGENQDDLLGGIPYTDVKVRISIGSTKGASDIHTADIIIANNWLWTDTELNFIPGAGNNNCYISVALVWVGGVVPDLFFNGSNASYIMQMYLGVHTWIAPLAGGSGAAVEFTSPWTEEQLECLQYCMDPGEGVMIFTHPLVETHRLRLVGNEWTFESISNITLPTAYIPPNPNSWTPGNFPAACAYHEGRLWLGGTPNQPATLWASRSGNYQDFNASAPTNKSDPLLFPLSSAGFIQTLTSRKELVINTGISEVIGTSVQGVIAFDDFSFPKQTDWGSNCVQPIVIGRDMIYTSSSKKNIRTFSDEGGTNFGWDGNELSLLAADIFKSPVRRMVYLDEPSYLACFLLADGSLGMATYYYPEKAIGWWRYTTAYNGDRTYGDTTKPGLSNQLANTTQNKNQVMDITKINTSQGAKLWMIVNRVGYSGTTLPAHELIGFDTGLVTALDSYVTRSVSIVDGTCDDLGIFIDQSVNVVVEVQDPADPGVIYYTVHPNITVDVGNISSPLQTWAWGQTAYLGLFYKNDIQLLSVEGVSNRGTSQVSKRRWNKLFLRLNNSAIPLVEGQYPKDRTPATPMGSGEPFITGDVDIIDMGSGEGDLVIIQDKPLISEITGLFGKVKSTEI